MNNYQLATDEYSYKYVKYPKKFSWKAFKKFGWIKGQLLCEKYDIILTDHMTKKERYNYLFDRAIDRIKKGGKKFLADERKKKKKRNWQKEFFGDPPRKTKRKRGKKKEWDSDNVTEKIFGKKKPSIF